MEAAPSFLELTGPDSPMGRCPGMSSWAQCIARSATAMAQTFALGQEDAVTGAV